MPVEITTDPILTQKASWCVYLFDYAFWSFLKKHAPCSIARAPGMKKIVNASIDSGKEEFLMLRDEFVSFGHYLGTRQEFWGHTSLERANWTLDWLIR